MLCGNDVARCRERWSCARGKDCPYDHSYFEKRYFESFDVAERWRAKTKQCEKNKCSMIECTDAHNEYDSYCAGCGEYGHLESRECVKSCGARFYCKKGHDCGAEHTDQEIMYFMSYDYLSRFGSKTEICDDERCNDLDMGACMKAHCPYDTFCVACQEWRDKCLCTDNILFRAGVLYDDDEVRSEDILNVEYCDQKYYYGVLEYEKIKGLVKVRRSKAIILSD